MPFDPASPIPVQTQKAKHKEMPSMFTRGSLENSLCRVTERALFKMDD
jgi:hypothetical protein